MEWIVSVWQLVSFQYLPVYTPSAEEKENPSLFANNVRKLMAKYVCVCVLEQGLCVLCVLVHAL